MSQSSLALVEPPRLVLHVNTDDFFASLARLRDPGLRRQPVVVGNLLNRGSVVSASYEARAEGIHPGLTMQQAERRAPGAAFVQVDWAYARRASHELFGVLEGYGPRVERRGLDEAFVDYSGCERLLGQPLDAGARLRGEVRQRLSLDVSIGVGSNKLVSRFASSAAKRHSLLDVLPGYEASFLAPHPVERLPGVGAKLGHMLRDMGVATVGDLGRIPEDVLATVFGRTGRWLALASRGVDRTPVGGVPARAVLMEHQTFEPDVLEQDVLEAWVDVLASRLGNTLRRRGLTARSVRVGLEHSDHVSVQRRTRLPTPTHQDARLGQAARRTFALLYKRRVRVRRLVLEVSGFEPTSVQLDLFCADDQARERRLLRAADRIRARYPVGSVLVRAASLVAVPSRIVPVS